MDPELNVLLKALVDGQVNLASGQDRMAVRQDRMEDAITDLTRATEHMAVRQDRMEDAITEMSGTIDHLADKIDKLTDRLDEFGQAVVRGFTQSVSRDSELERRVSRLEEEVERFKNQQPPGP